MTVTAAAGTVTNSTRNFINNNHPEKLPLFNLTSHIAPPIAAASMPSVITATNITSSITKQGAHTLTSSSVDGGGGGGERGSAAVATVNSTQLSSPPSSAHPPPGATSGQLTTIPLHPTKATIITNSKRPTIIIYPTVSPESIVIPIVSCILGFPLLALLVICCLRRRAKLARERDRRRNYDMQDHAVSLVRFSPIHRLNNRPSRAISLRPERSLSRGFPSLELDTVIEERSDPEQTQTDIISPESPLDPHKYRGFNSS